jgi:hypothetical protein
MRWKEFFIGVRWLGPDLSFFRELKQRQAARTPSQMDVWGSGRRREIAESLSQAFKKEVGWRTSVFLPDDSFHVLCHEPSFSMLGELGGIAAMMRFEEQYGVRIPKSFWAGREHAKLWRSRRSSHEFAGARRMN